ncbi:MAG: hypothetical protein ABFD54_15020 [Armatimonadota bacterium]|nr:hypothetical protein [bacterium]
MPYVLLKVLKHNGVRYPIGAVAPTLNAAEKKRLLALGAIEETVGRRAEVSQDAATAKPTKKELLARAEELGIDVSDCKTVDELMAAIPEGDSSVDQTATVVSGDGLPTGIDPKLAD